MEQNDIITGPSPTVTIEATARRAALAGCVGSFIEYFDLTLYGFLAVFVSPVFFPNSDPTASLLAGLLVFASGFLTRPLGGIFFGWVGDRLGRKRALVTTVISMGVSTTLIGVLPSHAVAGAIAPILLVVLRLAAGFASGGEIGGSATYVAESVPAKRRGFFGAFTPMGSQLGFAVAAAAVAIASTTTSNEQMAAWGWRIPFLICLPFTLISLWARLKLDDTPEFVEAKADGETSRFPLFEAFRSSRGALIRVFVLAAALNGAGYLATTYFSIFLIHNRQLPATTVYWLTACAIVVTVLAMPFLGGLSDRFGRRVVQRAGMLGLLVTAYPVLAVLSAADNLILVGVAYAVFLIFLNTMNVSAFPLYTELFPRKVRYTGVSFSYNIAAILLGSTAPYLAATLIEKTGDQVAPAYWVMGLMLIGILALIGLKETANTPLAR